jgi:hypothetical protein
MASSGMSRRVALVRVDDLKESIRSIIRVTRIGEIGTTLAVINNRRMPFIYIRPLVETCKSYELVIMHSYEQFNSQWYECPVL